MAIKKVYKSSLSHITYVSKTGQNCIFTDYEFITDDQRLIDELETEIKSKHPFISVDPNKTEIDTSLQDQLREAQAAAVQKVLSERAAAGLSGAKVAGQAGQQPSEIVLASQTAQTVDPVPVPAQSISPATLLNVTTSASLSGLSGLSSSPAA